MLEEDNLFELYGTTPPNLISGLSPSDERVFLMTAALFAFHPKSFGNEQTASRHRNLGESLRMLGEAMSSGTGPELELPDSLKRRVEAMLGAPRDEVFGHLRQMVSLLKTKEVPVDWAQLLFDLTRWDRAGRPVQWEWSRAFFADGMRNGGKTADVR